jgi:hypothetical protein
MATTRDRGILSSCNKVLAIPELLDLITYYLNIEGLKIRVKFTHVCRHWYQYVTTKKGLLLYVILYLLSIFLNHHCLSIFSHQVF